MPRIGEHRRVILLLTVLSLVASACSFQTRNLVPPVPQVAQTSTVLARDGRLITEPPSDENRTVVTIDEIPEVMRNAIIAIEDERFYLHDGADLKGLFRSASRGVTSGAISGGGSTITMQYVGNVFLDRSQQTASRKLEEIVLARQFEEQFSKDFILAEYLNWVFFGARSYGIESASQQYFGVSVSNLTLPQAALLAGLVQQPSRLNPYVNPEGAIGRREVVLDAMLRNDFITVEEHEAAVADPLILAPENGASSGEFPGGHFFEEVKAWILNGEFITEEWAEENPERANELSTYQAREDLFLRGGIRVRTTLDLDLQAQAEAAIESIIPEGNSLPDAAAVVIEPDTGEVLAMVGGRDFFGDSDFANVNLAVGNGRQAGSAFKPILLAAAIEQGISVRQEYEAPREITLQPPDLNEPWNVRGGAPSGVADLLDATVWSRNTVFAQLAVQLGPGTTGEYAERLGVESDIAPVYASVLGTENTTTLDLAAAYATFANRGVQNDPVFVSEIINPDGTTLWSHEPQGERVLDTDTADQISFVLGEVINRGTGQAANFGRPAAGKTGTAQNFADATFAGYTPDLAAAVWVGFPQGQISMVPCDRKTCTEEDPGTPIEVSGGTYPAQIWREIMAAAHADIAPSDFPTPPPSRPVPIELPESVDTPDLFGLTVAQANNQLTGTSLVLSPVEIDNESFPPNTIINQSPPAGQTVPGGATVIVEVATEPLRVPDVLGLNLADARRLIRAEGFTDTRMFVDTNGDSVRANDLTDATVIRQTPRPGANRDAGFNVSIVLEINE